MKSYYIIKTLCYKSFMQLLLVKGTDESDRHYVVLSNTAFYPTGGGQPHDTGTLNALEVIDVEKVDDEIRHYIEGDLSTLDGVVHGKLNWPRRFDHIGGHAGQHILTTLL